MGEIRVIKSRLLDQDQIDRLDGATVLDPFDLDAAIIAVFDSEEGPVAVYDYDRLCHCFYDDNDPDSTWEHAMEWVDYNIVRGLPYMRPRAPIVLMRVESGEADDFGEDAVFHRVGEFEYVQL